MTARFKYENYHFPSKADHLFPGRQIPPKLRLIKSIQGVKFSAAFEPLKPQSNLSSPCCSGQQPFWQVQVIQIWENVSANWKQHLLNIWNWDLNLRFINYQFVFFFKYIVWYVYNLMLYILGLTWINWTQTMEQWETLHGTAPLLLHLMRFLQNLLPPLHLLLPPPHPPWHQQHPLPGTGCKKWRNRCRTTSKKMHSATWPSGGTLITLNELKHFLTTAGASFLKFCKSFCQQVGQAECWGGSTDSSGSSACSARQACDAWCGIHFQKSQVCLLFALQGSIWENVEWKVK